MQTASPSWFVTAIAGLVASCAGCGSSPRGKTVGNGGPGREEATELAVDASTPLGVLALPAFATRPAEAPFWVAITPDAPGTVAVVPTPAALVPGTAYTAIPAGGDAPVTLTAGAPITIKYGCDDTPLEVIPLTGAAVTPGLIWVLPSPLPAGWKPARIPLTGPGHARELSRIVAGPLDIRQLRKDKTHAVLLVHVGDHLAHQEENEAYLMNGADPIDLDLSEDDHTPGIPTLEAVFELGSGGPYLVVFDRSGYEGVAFETLLVGHKRAARTIESLGLGAYYCAF